MFGLTFEKLLLVAIIAGVLIGPQRLPHHAHQLGRTIRSFRDFMESTRVQAEREMGVSLRPAEWDLTQYDPRRIVREAMQEPRHEPDPRIEEARRVRPGQKHVVTGSTSHPRRILIESLLPDDPRRLAAERMPPVDNRSDVESGVGGRS
jgi:sec-independent protein translocase protein TatB